MRFRQPHVQRHEPRLRAEAEQREQERDRRPVRREVRRAHRIERELPAAALHHAEAQQDRDRADVRDQQVEKARAADLGNACCVVTRKYDDSAIVSHATMNAYASSASSTKPMLARNRWYCRHSRPGERALARAEIAGGEHRNPGGGGAEQEQKHAGQRVAAQVQRQVGQADRQTSCSTASRGSRPATTASATPHSAPSGNSVRPTNRRLIGRSRPASADEPQSAEQRKAGGQW